MGSLVKNFGLIWDLLSWLEPFLTGWPGLTWPDYCFVAGAHAVVVVVVLVVVVVTHDSAFRPKYVSLCSDISQAAKELRGDVYNGVKNNLAAHVEASFRQNRSRWCMTTKRNLCPKSHPKHLLSLPVFSCIGLAVCIFIIYTSQGFKCPNPNNQSKPPSS